MHPQPHHDRIARGADKEPPGDTASCQRRVFRSCGGRRRDRDLWQRRCVTVAVEGGGSGSRGAAQRSGSVEHTVM
jgi:hypothetical protein